MPTPRASIEELALHATPQNFKKALHLRATKPEPTLAKREELEQLFNDAKAEYERVADDVRIRGSVLTVTKFTPKGKSYETEIVNPSYRVMRSLVQQMNTLAAQLTRFDKVKPNTGVVPGSAAAMFPEIFSKEQAS
jgi:hypothetical protein